MDRLARALVARQPGRIRPDLERLGHALKRLGHPQRSFKSLQVVGTNGKGSTAAVLERLLRAAEIRTGLMTSPHLIRVNERIQVNGLPIGDDELLDLLQRLQAFPDLTYFETITAAAFLYFAETGVEIAVLEAGMGGRWDASSLGESAIAGLTNVGTDHLHWLGPDRRAIAGDKGAALQRASIGVYGPQVEDWIVAELALDHARKAGDRLRLAAGDTPGRMRAERAGRETVHFEMPFAGDHQIANVHLAMELAEACTDLGWIEPLSARAVARAVEETRWPGRLSRIRIRNRPVLIDGAHNQEAMQALVTYLRHQPERYNLVFSCLKDKDVQGLASLLRPVVGSVAVCPLDDPHAMGMDALLQAFPGARACAAPVDALDCLDDPILATGSLRLVGALMAREDPR